MTSEVVFWRSLSYGVCPPNDPFTSHDPVMSLSGTLRKGDPGMPATFKRLTVDNWLDADETLQAFGRLSPATGAVRPIEQNDFAATFLAIDLQQEVPADIVASSRSRAERCYTAISSIPFTPWDKINCGASVRQASQKNFANSAARKTARPSRAGSNGCAGRSTSL